MKQKLAICVALDPDIGVLLSGAWAHPHGHNVHHGRVQSTGQT
ncbi:hypothetical protein [Phyllobacterium bourgognense]|nr:hypothetical protein [Phyllobacterium bourgognense]